MRSPALLGSRWPSVGSRWPTPYVLRSRKPGRLDPNEKGTRRQPPELLPTTLARSGTAGRRVVLAFEEGYGNAWLLLTICDQCRQERPKRSVLLQ